jgi:hypothetical protein
MGWLAANMVVLNYTHLHAFTAFYHLFLGVNVTGKNEVEITTEKPRHRGVQMSEKVRWTICKWEEADGRRSEVGKGGR